jgi:hypothetical protein
MISTTTSPQNLYQSKKLSVTSMLLYVARNTQLDFRQKAKASGIPQLITIPYSHYVDFARWSLQSAGIKFEEHDYAPLQHVLPVLSVRVARKEKFISESAYVERVGQSSRPGIKIDAVTDSSPDSAETANRAKKRARAARSTAVPLCIFPDGRVLVDSWEIALEGGPSLGTPCSEEIKQLLDTQLGPLTRQLGYHHIFKPINKNVWGGLCTDGRHWVWRFLWWLGVGNFLTKMMHGIFKPFDEAAVAECRKKLDVVFARLEEEVLKPKGITVSEDGSLNGRYIHGTRPGITGTMFTSYVSRYCEL